MQPTPAHHRRPPRGPRLRLTRWAGSTTLALTLLAGCTHPHFPDVPAGYREFAYVTNGASNTVSVLDLVYMRPDRTLAVGTQPTGIAANPLRNEIYAVNAGSASTNGSVSVIDAEANAVVATIPVHKLPYAIAVAPDGRRAYVANSGSNTVSILDLDRRREIAAIGTGEQPGLARVSPDMRSLVVTNRGSGSVSIYALPPTPAPNKPSPESPGQPRLRAALSGCPGATDAVILADSSKAFVACSAGHQVMAIQLAADPATWPAKQNSALLTDRVLALLDVGQTPVQLALKPDGGEIFVSNFASDTISEIETRTNEVAGTYIIGAKPAFGIVSADNSTLWVSNFGAESINLWSIDDGRLGGSVRAGDAPDALAFSADEHLLLAANARSGDVAAIRTTGNPGPALFTIMPAGRSPNAIAVKAMQSKP